MAAPNLRFAETEEPLPSRPLRILCVAWKDLAHPEAGGAEVVVDELATRLTELGHEVTLLCAGPVAPRKYRVLESGGKYSQYLRAPVRYAREFRDVDVVVDFVAGMPFFSPWWRHRPRVAVVFHVHGEQWHRHFSAPIASTFRRVEATGLAAAYRGTDVVTISQSTAEDLVGLGLEPARVSVMHLGVNVEPLASPPPRATRPTFLYLGRIAPNKRVDLLLDMWPRVAVETGGRLVVAGDGPDREHIERRVASDPELADVVVEGRVDERRKAELFHEAWLFVHPAEREGWGLTLIEAARCGTPAVGFDVPGVRDAVVPGETGELASDPDGFVSAWIALANDAERRSALGERAALRSQQFRWEITASTFLAAACQAIGEQGTAAHSSFRGWLDAVRLSTQTTVPGRAPRLGRVLRGEATEPDAFSRYRAADTVRQVARYVDPRGALAVDIGGAPGHTAAALEAAGARCLVMEYGSSGFAGYDRAPEHSIVGDGPTLPLRDGCAGVVHSANVLEHDADWRATLDEVIRVLEPGHGVGYMEITDSYAPWRGRNGRHDAVESANRFRDGRGPRTSDVRAWLRSRPDVELLWDGSHYLPDWTRWVVRVPWARDLVTWNRALVFRRRPVGR